MSLVAALAACGGGGGSDSGPANTPPAPAPAQVSSAGTLQTTAPSPTYAASSALLSAYDALATVRQNAGAGLLVQNADLDISATAHATYLIANQAGGVTHTEDSTLPDFYATDFVARETKAGFSGFLKAETIIGMGVLTSGDPQSGTACVLNLMDTVYHAASLLSPVTYVGLGVVEGPNSAGYPLMMCVQDMGTAAADTTGQIPASGALVAYPYAGQSNVLETFQVSAESPRPPVAVLPNVTAGTPIVVSMRNADYVNAEQANTLVPTVTAFTLKDGSGNLVPAVILAFPALQGSAGVTLNADGNLPDGFTALVPVSPLLKGQTYTVTFSGTLGAGAALSKTWSFTTNN